MSSEERRSADAARAGHEEASRAVRVRSDPVHGNGRCALRAASLVRQRRRSTRRRRARALRGRGPSVRDVLSQRWVRTEKTYERQNPKRVYYLSMEFLIGRSLANNVMNLLLDREVQRVVADKGLDWLGVLEQEPDAGLGNGGLGRLAACFLDSMATMQLPAMGYGLRYEYGIFKQAIQDGWQASSRTTGCASPTPGKSPAPREGRGQAELLVRGARRDLQPVIGRPSTLIGLPFDRPVVGYGGKTINTLRLWAAAAPETTSTSRRSATASSSARWPTTLAPNR